MPRLRHVILFFLCLFAFVTQVHANYASIHGDHLGSTSWITDDNAQPVQYIHYAPYGELIANQRATSFDERYKFTGKERDAESSYDNFGARYWWSSGGHWLSVDPLANKYPDISPYAYCLWNPIKCVDPNGMDTKDVVIGYSLGVLTSLLPGTSFLRDAYSPSSRIDYNTALANVDNVSFILGGGMTAAGASGVSAGTAIAVAGGVIASSIAGAPEGAIVAVSGGVVITGSEALAIGGATLMANAV